MKASCCLALAFVVLSRVSSCGRSAPLPTTSSAPVVASQKAAVRAQALAQVTALVQEDHEAVADRAHRALVEAHGGRDGYVKQLAARAKSRRAAGLTYREPVELDDPVLQTGTAGVLFAFVPYGVTVERPGVKGLGPTDFLAGVSEDGGRTWRFLDRMSFRGDEARLRKLLPSLPADFRLPR